METNALYYGDNLDILRTCVPSESVGPECTSLGFSLAERSR
jgi:hypothetical protein